MKKKYLLNLGLAFVLIYAGIDQILNPLDWVGFLPSWLPTFGQSKVTALLPHSILAITLGLALLSNLKVRWVAGLTALFLASIVLGDGFDRGFFLITFRDVGLVCAAIYLALENK